MDRRHVVIGLGSMLTASGAAADTLGGDARAGLQRRPVRVAALGQALIEHAFTPVDWPGMTGLARVLSQHDVVFTNLESVIDGPRAGTPTRELLTLHKARPAVLETLKSVGVNLVATSNNHAFDLGSGGILDTLDALAAARLPAAGTGRDLAQAATHASVGEVALVAFASGKIRPGRAATATGPGVNEVRLGPDRTPALDDQSRILTAIRAAKVGHRHVLVYHHNHEWESDPSRVPDWQRRLAHACAGAGASAFIGHGVPFLQGYEWVEGTPCLYGLGNFFFQTEKGPGAYPPESWESVIADITFRPDGPARLRLVPIVLNETGLGGRDDLATRGAPALAGPRARHRILSRLQALSQAL